MSTINITFKFNNLSLVIAGKVSTTTLKDFQSKKVLIKEGENAIWEAERIGFKGEELCAEVYQIIQELTQEESPLEGVLFNSPKTLEGEVTINNRFTFSLILSREEQGKNYIIPTIGSSEKGASYPHA